MANERLHLRFVYSANTDHSSPNPDSSLIELTSSPTTVKWSPSMEITLSPTAVIAAGEWTTVTSLWVRNLDAAITLALGYTDAAATAQAIDILPGGAFFTQDADPSVAITLTPSAGTPLAEVWVTGT